MKTLAFVAGIALISISVLAADSLMNGGRSPDGHYEVRIAQDTRKEPSDYDIHLHGKETAGPFFSLGGSGYLNYSAAVERDRALWHSSSRFVVVTDQGTRHSRELYLFEVSPHLAQMLQLPDYVQIALRRVNATAVDHACVSTPQRWDGDDLIVELEFTTNGRHLYTCKVILHVSHGSQFATFVRLKSVSQPRDRDD